MKSSSTSSQNPQDNERDYQATGKESSNPLDSTEHVRRLQSIAHERGVVGLVRIGPITATCVLAPARIWQNTDLDDVRARFLVCGQQIGDSISILAHGRKSPTDMRVLLKTHRTKSNKFFNQLPFTCAFSESTRSVSIKLFANGKVHMTGLRTTEEVYSISEAFADVLADVCVRSARVQAHRILMINSNFKLGTPIQLRRVCDTLNSHVCWEASYNPDIYPAVNARNTALNTSVFLFGTGSIVIAAAKTYQILQETVRQLLEDILPTYSEHVNVTGREKRVV